MRSQSIEDLESSSSGTNRRHIARRHASRNPEHLQGRQYRSSIRGSSSVSTGSHRRRRRRPSQTRRRPRSSRHRRPVRPAERPHIRDQHGTNDRLEDRNRRRHPHERRTRRPRRDADHRAEYPGTRRTEPIRSARERRRHARPAEAVRDNTSTTTRSQARDRRRHMPFAPSPRLHRDASPAHLSVAVPRREAGPPNYDDLSEDELFAVILAEERAMDPFLRDLDARRARGEDV